MAFRDPGVPSDTLPNGFFNVSRSVGKGGSNDRGDLMLVQLLLKKYYAKIGSVLPEIKPPPGKMVVDGMYGPTTATWIVRFQLLQNPKWTRGIACDGLVDRAKDPWFGSISGTTYTILALNHRLRQLDPQGYERLASDPECPTLLAGELLFNGAD
jgi:hypothetical protein